MTEWRSKEYPAVELPKLFGDPHRRFSQGGSGFEAAVTKSACPACSLTNPSAPAPTPKSAFTMESVVDKPLRSQDVPSSLAFGRLGARFTARLPSDCFYPKGKVMRLVDRDLDKEGFLLVEEVRKKAEDVKFVEVSFKIIPKPVQSFQEAAS